jgi:hypothetical protein
LLLHVSNFSLTFAFAISQNGGSSVSDAYMFAGIFGSRMSARKIRIAIGLSLLIQSLQVRNGSAMPHQQSTASNSAAVTPELFSPGIISGPANGGSTTFAPDGNTLYLTRSTAAWRAILPRHRME